jgi:hypothetical protein
VLPCAKAQSALKSGIMGRNIWHWTPRIWTGIGSVSTAKNDKWLKVTDGTNTNISHRALVGAVAHWLDEDLRKQEVLIGLKRLKCPHSGEDIAAVIIPLLEWYNLAPKLGFFMDNDSTHDTVIRAILTSATGHSGS